MWEGESSISSSEHQKDRSELPRQLVDLLYAASIDHLLLQFFGATCIEGRVEVQMCGRPTMQLNLTTRQSHFFTSFICFTANMVRNKCRARHIFKEVKIRNRFKFYHRFVLQNSRILPSMLPSFFTFCMVASESLM